MNNTTITSMKRVAVYMRVSTSRQEEDQTIENQFMELKERIEQQGHLLLPDCIYKDEGWSGTILERPELDRMRTDARNGKFDILYTYDRGRLSRKFVHQEIVLDELKSCSVEYVSLHDINGITPEEILMGSVMGVFHEYEKLKITERMRLGKVRKVRESKKLLGYNPKYGYKYHPKTKTIDGHFTLNIKQAQTVRMIFEMIAAGNTKNQVRKKLFEDGVKPPKDRQEIWSAGTLDRLLKDTTYYGDHFYNKTESIPTTYRQKPEIKYRKVLKGSRKKRPKEEWMLIKVPPIIDKELFDKVQLQLNINKKLNPRNNKRHEYLVSGLIQCVCGKSRTGDPTSSGNTYYRCTDRLNRYPMPRECFEKAINSQVFDVLVWNQIKELLTNPKLIRDQAKRWHKKASPSKIRIDAIKVSLKALEDEERRYAKVFGEGLLSESLYKEQFNQINQKRFALNDELLNLENELRNTPSLTVEQIVEGTQKAMQSLDLTDKKFIIRKIVNKIVATQKEATICGHIPVIVTPQVGYERINRHCWFAQRWQIYPF